MPRINWLFPKKRGVRRTGSALGGRVGEAALYLSMFLLGVAAIIGTGWSYFTHSWPVDTFFPQVYYEAADAVVKARRVHAVEAQYQPQLLIEFAVEDDIRASWVDVGEAVVDAPTANAQLVAYHVGDEIRCWYDRRDPKRTTIEYSRPWGLWLTVLLLLVLAVAGGYGVINTALHVGASAERRAAFVQSAASRIKDSEELLPAARNFPTVPRDTNLLNSPGVKLKYRLPSNQEPAWRMFGSAVWMLTCGALAAALAVVAVEQHVSRKPSWFLTCFAVVVVGLAGWAIYSFLRELIGASWMGPTSMEISDLPLRPGGAYEIYLNQSGNLRVGHLSVLLVCDEETTFLQGTDIRHDRQRVFREEICRREQFEIDDAGSVEEHGALKIPPDAMHSFKSRFNALQWKLVVEIEAEDWPAYQRTFPLIVYPAAAGETKTGGQNTGSNA